MSGKSKNCDDNCLYHGSNNGDIEKFEPRQAVSFGKPDGPPAVHASGELDPAIFMAVLGSRYVGGWGLKNGTKFGFFVIDSHLKEARRENWAGFVYLLPKETFKNRRGWEWISTKAVAPIKRYEVGIKDLPTDIYVMTESEYEQYHKSQRPRK